MQDQAVVGSGAVVDPTKTSLPDNEAGNQNDGRQGDRLIAQTHGKWYESNYRNSEFIADTLVAGVAIPLTSATSINFGLYNPLFSKVNVELISFDLAVVSSATIIVGEVHLNFLTAQQYSTPPSGFTNLQAMSSGGFSTYGVGASANVARAFSACTNTSVASTLFYSMGIAIGTVTEQAGPTLAHHDFDGRVILAPGTICWVAGNVAQTVLFQQQLTWAEWPV